MNTTTVEGSAFAPTPAPRVDAGGVVSGAGRLGKATPAEQAPTPAPRLTRTPTGDGEPREDGAQARRARREADYDARQAALLAEEHEQWQGGHGPDTPTEARLRRTLLDLTTRLDPTGRNGDFVPIEAARAALPDLTTAEFDTALLALESDPAVIVSSNPDQQTLTPTQQQAAIQIGGKPKHLIRVYDTQAGTTRPAGRPAAHEPGTGPDWANAKGPQGMKPLAPATTTMRAWEAIGARQVPTDREYLAHLDATIAAEAGDGEWAYAVNTAAQLRKRAANGRHDGSLPELGHYRPVYFVPDPPTDGSTR